MSRIPERVLLDTNLIIDLQRRNPVAVSFYQQLTRAHLVVSGISYLEVAVGEFRTDPRAEQSLNKLFFLYRIVPFTNPMILRAVRIATRLGREALSMGNDIAIAATAIEESRTLLTHNLEDFRRIKGLKVLDWFDLA